MSSTPEPESGCTCIAASLSLFITGLLLLMSWQRVTVSRWELWRGHQSDNNRIRAGIDRGILFSYLLHKTRSATMHKLSHAVCVISSMWKHFLAVASVWPLTNHIHRSEPQTWPRISPRGSCLSTLNHHREPTLNRSLPPAWAPAPFSLGSKAG